jgi:hypothetical protein
MPSDASAGASGTGGGNAGHGGSGGSGGNAGSGGSAGGSAGSGAGGATGGKGGAAGAGGGIDAGRISPLGRVQRGSTTVAAGMATQKVTLQQLDPSRSFVVFGTRFDSSAPADMEVTGQITSPTELTFARAGAMGSPAVPVYYYVAEFQSGVRVQRGSATLSSTTVNAALTSVDLTKSFPIVTYRNTGGNPGRDDFVRGKLTSASQLSIVDDLAAPNGIAEWQVVTFDGAAVQSGDIALTQDTNTYTADLQPVDRAKTWLLFGYNLGAFASGNGVAQKMIRGRVASATQLAFRRAVGGASGTLTWYAVSFTNGASVQTSTATMADLAMTTASLPGIDPTKTIASAGGLYYRAGATPITTNESPGQSTFTLEVTGGTQLSIVRGPATAGSAPEVDWFTVSFP